MRESPLLQECAKAAIICSVIKVQIKMKDVLNV